MRDRPALFSLSKDAARRILIVGGFPRLIPPELRECRHVELSAHRVTVPSSVRHVIVVEKFTSHSSGDRLAAQPGSYRTWHCRGGRLALLKILAQIVHLENAAMPS